MLNHLTKFPLFHKDSVKKIDAIVLVSVLDINPPPGAIIKCTSDIMGAEQLLKGGKTQLIAHFEHWLVIAERRKRTNPPLTL